LGLTAFRNEVVNAADKDMGDLKRWADDVQIFISMIAFRIREVFILLALPGVARPCGIKCQVNREQGGFPLSIEGIISI